VIKHNYDVGIMYSSMLLIDTVYHYAAEYILIELLCLMKFFIEKKIVTDITTHLICFICVNKVYPSCTSVEFAHIHPALSV